MKKDGTLTMDKIFREIDIIDNIFNCKRDNVDVATVMDLSASLNREIHIPEVLEGCGGEVDLAVRYWNRLDEEKRIPVEERQPILFYIDCSGGNLTDAFMISDTIRQSKTPVYTIITGAALSGGFIIAISGHKRIAYPHASFLFHEGSGGFGGDANKFANFALFYKKQLEQMKDIILNQTSITEEKYKEIKNDDYWMTADEALELGVIDEIYGSDTVI